MVHLHGDPASHVGLVGLIRVHQVDKGGIPSKHTLHDALFETASAYP